MPRTDFAGIYNSEYFSGAQVSVYIGDVWVDEITSLSFQVEQKRAPLYGYADTYFRDVSKGQVLVQGSFTINFKEAGYLFLILDRYQTIMNGRVSLLEGNKHQSSLYSPGATGPFSADHFALQETIETITDNNTDRMSGFERLRSLKNLAASLNFVGPLTPEEQVKKELRAAVNAKDTGLQLRGYSSHARGFGGIGAAENIYEKFENKIWGSQSNELDKETRRADDPRLNPFDIFVSYGDFQGDDNINHTIRKLSGVHILGTTQQISPDGIPIQEQYSFIARNIV